MTILLSVFSAGLMALLLWFVYGLDSWLGLLAYEFQYLGFSALIAGALAAIWLAKAKRASLAVGLGAFLLMLSPYVVGTPSARILRQVMQNVPVGTESDDVEAMMVAAYSESGYAMPHMKRDEQRLFVSLMTQQPGDCTAAIFYLADGRVTGQEFSAD